MPRQPHGAPQRPLELGRDTRQVGQKGGRGEADEKQADDDHRQQTEDRADPFDPPPTLVCWVVVVGCVGHDSDQNRKVEQPNPGFSVKLIVERQAPRLSARWTGEAPVPPLRT